MRGAATAALLVLPVLLAGGQPAFAFRSADWLREACADGDLYYLSGACGGYMLAVADRLKPGTEICPDGPLDLFTHVGQAAADALPGLAPVAGESAEALAERALRAALPCE